MENSFFCPPSDNEETVNLIRRQKSKSTEMNIPVFIYKILAPLIIPSVSMLFNNSLSEGIFTDGFKSENIIHIFKSGDSNSTANNYKPISMLPFLSKTFEKLTCARLDSYLKSNNILCTNQFGFRKNSNTSDAIIEFLDYVYSSLDKKHSIIVVYPVNHEILMIMLE